MKNNRKCPNCGKTTGSYICNFCGVSTVPMVYKFLLLVLFIALIISCKKETVEPIETVNITVITKRGSDSWSYQQLENISLEEAKKFLEKGKFVNIKLSRGSDDTYKY